MIVVEFIPPSIFLQSPSRREKFSSQSIKISTAFFFWLLFKCQAYLIFVPFLRKLKPNWELSWNQWWPSWGSPDYKVSRILTQTPPCLSRRGFCKTWRENAATCTLASCNWQPVRSRKETSAEKPALASAVHDCTYRDAEKHPQATHFIKCDGEGAEGPLPLCCCCLLVTKYKSAASFCEIFFIFIHFRFSPLCFSFYINKINHLRIRCELLIGCKSISRWESFNCLSRFVKIVFSGSSDLKGFFFRIFTFLLLFTFPTKLEDCADLLLLLLCFSCRQINLLRSC